MSNTIAKRYRDTSRGKREKFNRRKKSISSKLYDLNEVCGAKYQLVLQRNNKYFVFTSEEDTESWPPPLEMIVSSKCCLMTWFYSDNHWQKKSYPPPLLICAKDYEVDDEEKEKELSAIPVLAKPETSPVQVRAPKHPLSDSSEMQ
jgi:hypothetical protein